MTITEKENEDMMKDYGKITDINITQPAPEPTSVINTPQSQVTNEQKETVKIVTETEVPLQKTERKYVVCPSCGEVIYID